MEVVKKDEGLRLNDGKIRYDLLEPYAIEQVAKIFTKGARKYAPHNWLRGMAWSKMVASLKRHLAAYERGEDYDFDPLCEGCKAGDCTNHTGELHIAQVAWNALGITSYYKHFPQGDDRLHTMTPKPRYGLDIDDVLCYWVPAWAKKHGLAEPTSWSFDRAILDKFKAMEDLDEFYLGLEVKTKPEEIPFEPVVYVTSRPVDTAISEEWLDKHGFPAAPVVTVGSGGSKVQALKDYNVDIFVDDNYGNFLEVNKAGICCYLFDACHNQRYDVGYKRIKSLQELKR